MSKPGFLEKLKQLEEKHLLSKKYHKIILGFFENYQNAAEKASIPASHIDDLFSVFLEKVEDVIKKPFPFSYFHQAIRSPFDYYQFGLDFVRPLFDEQHSSIKGLSEAKKMLDLLQKKDNVVLLANHQTEADPQAISLLLEKTYPKLAEEMIFVAGERVIKDPLAIPFSMGRNLLCIYSKKYIDQPLAQKREKQLHNQKTMEKMKTLLSQGGKIIYVAPSGGRDRPEENGKVSVAPFDPDSIELFHIIAKKAKHPTHFFPLALATYDLMPPPDTLQIEMGEQRSAKRVPIHLAFGQEIPMELFDSEENKFLRRKRKAEYIYTLVLKEYNQFN